MKVGDRVVCIKSTIEGIINAVKGVEYDILELTACGEGIIIDGAISSHISNGFSIYNFRKIETYNHTINEVNFNIVEEGLEQPLELT